MFDIRNQSGPSTERSKVSEQFPEELKKRHPAAHWIAITVLAAAIGGLCWYGYPAMSQAPAMLAQLPGLQKSLESVNTDLAEMATRIKDWGRSQQELQDHVAKFEKETASRFHSTRNQVQGLRAEVGQRVHAEVAAETLGIETKLAQLDSTSASGRADLDKIQTEVAALRDETVHQAEQLQNARSEIERQSAIRDQQLASLNAQIGREMRDAEDLAKKLAVKRVDFEVTRNHNQELTEGVSLDITATDVSHRRVTGWMWIMPDRRTIWLRAQGAQQPAVFYGYQDGRRRELVITNVTKDSVTGYLLLPGDAGSNTSRSLSSGY
jgi:hypothetical protein